MRRNLKSVILYTVVLMSVLMLLFGCKATSENDLYKQSVATKEPKTEQTVGMILEPKTTKTEQKPTQIPNTPQPTKTPEDNTNKNTNEDKKTENVVVFDQGTTLQNNQENKISEDNNKTNYCSLVVNCETILNNMDKLKNEKHHLVPHNGIILSKEKVEFNEGESAFNVLRRELKREKIHMEFVDTPMYNSVYIEGINNIYEFDCGGESGWTYYINELVPNYGISEHILEDGDKIVLYYVCDRSKDIWAQKGIEF